MGRKDSKQTKGKRKSLNKQTGATDGWLWIDPARIRFQHARIRPYFSGCGRSVMETLESIRRGELSPADLPPIQVIVGPEDSTGIWYFSLNNRRLYVLKRCREEGLLENDLVRVRVRQVKSENEMERYTLDNCALEAKFIREKEPKMESKNSKDICLRDARHDETSESAGGENTTVSHKIREIACASNKEGKNNYNSESNNESDSSKDGKEYVNPFNVNLGTDTDSDDNDYISNSRGYVNPFSVVDSDSDTDFSEKLN
mmetsp:Transcript_27314/g.38415  ORF Transcript_27314/g.38415 Transcript_27314/m.38415 type:complete len:258 (-) Transcript_27314:6747-7520(-)